MTPDVIRFCLTIAFSALISAVGFGCSAAPSTLAPLQAPGTLAPKTIGDVLGSSPAIWQITPLVDSGSILPLLGDQGLATGDKTFTLNGPAVRATDVQYEVKFALQPTPKAGAALSFLFGLNTPEEAAAPLTPAIYISAAPDAKAVSCYTAGGDKGAYHSISTYTMKAVAQRSLSWPEIVRRSVERDLASLPGVREKWFTLRVVVHKDSVLTYIDDRLLDVREQAGLQTLGHMRLVLAANTVLASFRVTPVSPVDAAFRPVEIGGLLNSSTFAGSAVAPIFARPASEALQVIHGVPFVFPSPDAHGNNHIDLRPSWAQFSALEGYIESTGGEFAGRWPNALSVNPARIQLRVPADGYSALHVIAAADDFEPSVPVITAMFFKPHAGYPESFSARVPAFSAASTDAAKIPLTLANGTKGWAYLVTIPIDPARLEGVAENGILDVELTKQAHNFVSYPDPICFSFNGGGLPSSVHVFAMTLERSPVAVSFDPDKFANVFTAPVVPGYTAKLRNRTAAARTVEVDLDTVSHDGQEKTRQTQKISVPVGDVEVPVKFAIAALKKFGYHTVRLTVKDGANSWVENRTLAFLHPQTRTIGGWEDGQGPLLGYYAWGGAHGTPDVLHEMDVMCQAGAETTLADLGAKELKPEVRDFATAHGMQVSSMFTPGMIYTTAFAFGQAKFYDPSKPEATGQWLVDELKKTEHTPSPICFPKEVLFFPEPGIGPISFGTWPDYYGEKDYKLSTAEQTAFDAQLTKFLIGARAVRKQWPNAKILLPHGDPGYVIPFLRYSPEATALIDGVALDMPAFERLPESQLHQVVQHRLYQMANEFKKVGKKPYLMMEEGPCADTPPGALDFEAQEQEYTRGFLLYFAYGVYRHPSGPTPFDCSNYWGEEHYGCCGLFTRLPYACPKPSYVSYATMSRHLNRANFEKWIPTGSLSTCLMQFKHYKSGKLIHTMYTIRGKRGVALAVPRGAKISVFDMDDNETVLTEKDGVVNFTITPSPIYIEGLTADAQPTLAEQDNSDAAPAKETAKLTNLADGKWKIEAKRDETYEDNDAIQIVRFLGKMSAHPVDAGKEQGGQALAVHLEKQDVERKVMPWYTTLVPSHAVEVPGKASHLGLWVHAASDWGRVVYCLRDAKGQRWISIGTKDSWNCDDTQAWSYFNFDGWRYLRFPMPSNLPYDSFRERGSTWWGHFGPGDGVVALPLSIEKIIVERRTHAMYINDPQPTTADDVLLGDLYAEYAQPFDKTDAAVKLSRVRMPMPQGVPGLDNPITPLIATGGGDPTQITKVEPPAHGYDGTRCVVTFDKIATAVSYSIWVSPYEDGTGALELGKNWTDSGQTLAGLRPDTDFYAFLVYHDKDGKNSKPSKPFKIRLKDMFGMK